MMNAGALAKIKLLDLSRVLEGPWPTQILADFGTDAIKIEVLGKGHDTPVWEAPFLKDADGQDELLASADYLACDRNKRSSAANFAELEGAAVIQEHYSERDNIRLVLNESELGRKVTAMFECLCCQCQCGDRWRHNRSDTWNGHRSAGNCIFTDAPSNSMPRSAI